MHADSVQPEIRSSGDKFAFAEWYVQQGVCHPHLADSVHCEMPYSPRVMSCAHVGNSMQAWVALGSVPASRVLPVETALGTALVEAYHPLKHTTPRKSK